MSEESARWRRVEELCQAALERDVHDRAMFLTAACGDDDALRREGEALLASDRSAASRLPVGVPAP
jgi:hypothetical protein